MRTLTGNLIKLAQQGYFDVTIRGCNCFCTMGAGIAKSLRKSWRERIIPLCVSMANTTEQP